MKMFVIIWQVQTINELFISVMKKIIDVLNTNQLQMLIYAIERVLSKDIQGYCHFKNSSVFNQAYHSLLKFPPFDQRTLNSFLKNPTMHHFVTEMCTCAHVCYKMIHCWIFVWHIVRFVRGVKWLICNQITWYELDMLAWKGFNSHLEMKGKYMYRT